MHSVSLPNFVERYPEGLWATPTVNNSKNNAGPSQMDRHGPALDVQVTQWPTPATSQDFKPIRQLAPSEEDGTHGTMLVGAVGNGQRLGPDHITHG